MASHRRKEELMDGVAPGQSIRHRSQVLGIRRQTYHARKKGHRPEQVDEQIAQLLHQTVAEYVAWGFWMVYHYLRRKGHTWNHKRIYRVWKQEQLNLRRKPSRPVIRRKYLDLQAPNEINKGWAMDFVSDWVVGPKDKQVRIINVIDECSRRALWTEAHFNITAKTLITVLNQIVAWRGKPQYIRCDNGPEFISKELKDWADDKEIDIWFTQPGKPSQNGLIERLNGTLRRECLNLQWFKNLDLLNEALQY